MITLHEALCNAGKELQELGWTLGAGDWTGPVEGTEFFEVVMRHVLTAIDPASRIAALRAELTVLERQQ